MQTFFFVFFLQNYTLVLLIKTEIKFNLNVPSLFRCKQNGRVLYFDNFPSDQMFNQMRNCELSLISSERRIIFDVDKLKIQCSFKFSKFENRVNEILFFKSNCSENYRCPPLTPSNALIITDYLTKSDNAVVFDIRLNGIGMKNIQIGDEEQYLYSYENDGYKRSGSRKKLIVFKMEHKKYLNMMCQYTYINNPKDKPICPYKYTRFQIRIGNMTSTGEGWSWLCYYYPSGTEDPMDYTMINKAFQDIGEANSYALRIVSVFPNESFDNSSILLNQTNRSSSIPLIALLLIFIIVGGIFYIYKKNEEVNSRESDGYGLTRESLASQNSLRSNDS